MDADRHREAHHLDRIRSWPDDDHVGLMVYVEPLWRSGEWGWKLQRNPFTGRVVSRTYQISTGGFPGNEAIVSALEANRSFWRSEERRVGKEWSARVGRIGYRRE